MVGVLGQHEVAQTQRVRPLKQIYDRPCQRADACQARLPRSQNPMVMSVEKMAALAGSPMTSVKAAVTVRTRW